LGGGEILSKIGVSLAGRPTAFIGRTFYESYMHKVFSDIWKIYPENMFRNRTWHWWWWVHFFENPDNPEFPKQLMILWGTRNCRKVRVDDFYWEPRIPMRANENHATFESMVASWYYDGNKMHDPFILDKGKTETEWEDRSGRIKMENDQADYSFGGTLADFWLKVNSRNVEIELSMPRWNDVMAELVPTEKTFIGNMGYSMLKYRGLLSSGKIRVGETETLVRGRSYFQKVRISSITPSWYWATVQWDNGAYLHYFLPHIGPPMLRRSISHKSLMDWGEKIVSKTLNFYDAEEGREHSMKEIIITKRYENDLPIFKVSAFSDEAELNIEMATYARCCWHIWQPLIGPIWHGIFYNEYPARVIDFEFRTGARRVGKDDFGKSYCNCEHTWGTV